MKNILKNFKLSIIIIIYSLREMHRMVEEFQKQRDIESQSLLDNILQFIQQQSNGLEDVRVQFKGFSRLLTDKFQTMCDETVMKQLKDSQELVDASQSKVFIYLFKQLNLWYKAVCDKIEAERVELTSYNESKKAEIDEYEQFIANHCKGIVYIFILIEWRIRC